MSPLPSPEERRKQLSRTGLPEFNFRNSIGGNSSQKARGKSSNPKGKVLSQERVRRFRRTKASGDGPSSARGTL